MFMYESPADPPDKSASSFEENGSVWSALANTERWISDTVAGFGASNPYSRKEVIFVCDQSDNTELLVSGIFRRLREVRELGDNHAEIEKERKIALGDRFKPRTFRQTFVIVIPFCKDAINSYPLFDKLITKINASRRNARDYVTEISIENQVNEEGIYMDEEWSTSVSMAQLHPNYGELTPEQRLTKEAEEAKRGEVDLNYEAYEVKRMKARQSPYPTVVLEVKSMPPMEIPQDEMRGRNARDSARTGSLGNKEESSEVTRADLNKLEALFSQSATFAHPGEQSDEGNEEDFYDSIAKTGIQEVTFINPVNLAKSWVSSNDPFFQEQSSSFDATPSKYVDEAYEFLFSFIAMNLSIFEENNSAEEVNLRNYLIMSNFLSSSATSFEKFMNEVNNIIDAIPNLREKLSVSDFHPEHVDKEKRSPQPIMVLQWHNNE